MPKLIKIGFMSNAPSTPPPSWIAWASLEAYDSSSLYMETDKKKTYCFFPKRGKLAFLAYNARCVRWTTMFNWNFYEILLHLVLKSHCIRPPLGSLCFLTCTQWKMCSNRDDPRFLHLLVHSWESGLRLKITLYILIVTSHIIHHATKLINNSSKNVNMTSKCKYLALPIGEMHLND